MSRLWGLVGNVIQNQNQNNPQVLVSAQDSPHFGQGCLELGGGPDPLTVTAQGRTPPCKQSISPQKLFAVLSWLGLECGARGGQKVHCSQVALPLTAQAEIPRWEGCPFR